MRLAPRLRPLFPQLKAGYVHATAMMSPISTGLSRLRGGYVPSGIAWRMEDAVAPPSGGRVEVVRTRELLSRPQAIGVPAQHPSFAAVSNEDVPRVAVAELVDGRVLGPHRAVISGSGLLLHEVSHYFGTTRPRQHPVFANPFPVRPLQVEGRLGVLASRGDSNYYHFMFDVLPRLGVMDQCSTIEKPQRWYVPAGLPFQRELLAMFGIQPDQIIDANVYPHVQAGCLVVPGLPATHVLNPPWVVAFLREKLLGSGENSSRQRRRIYLSRGASPNNRSVRNEDEVIRALIDRGFEVVDPSRLSVADQIALFASARTIVSPHGAGETNLVFCGPGTRVVELFPSGDPLPDCYWRMAYVTPGVSYRYLAEPAGAMRRSVTNSLVRDMTVDISALADLIDGEAPL